MDKRDFSSSRVFDDQDETVWPEMGQQANISAASEQSVPSEEGIHTDLNAAPSCRALSLKHSFAVRRCVGLRHSSFKREDEDRYVFRGEEEEMRKKSNEILTRFWCEQQSHGLTNLCYFISETEKVCFDALGIPCDQFYGWLDRGPKSFPHAWVRLGKEKQLIDITFYAEKAPSFPGGYWVRIGEYQTGERPKTMVEENDFKKSHHWRYMTLCSLIEDRRCFLQCMFSYMIDTVGVEIPDIFKWASSSCWNCDKSLEGDSVRCSRCDTAVFCNEKCRAEERSPRTSHLEVCEDYYKRGIKIMTPGVGSLQELLDFKQAASVSTKKKN